MVGESTALEIICNLLIYDGLSWLKFRSLRGFLLYTYLCLECAILTCGYFGLLKFWHAEFNLIAYSFASFTDFDLYMV